MIDAISIERSGVPVSNTHCFEAHFLPHEVGSWEQILPINSFIGQWVSKETNSIITYCEGDVIKKTYTKDLFPAALAEAMAFAEEEI